MADPKPSYQWPDDASERSQAYSRPDELELLRAESKWLKELVVQLSKMAIRNAVSAK
jgi:hypothetical protein